MPSALLPCGAQRRRTREHSERDVGFFGPRVTAESASHLVPYPAPDLPGQWIAHGPEAVVVTQEDPAQHALAMMAGALRTLTSHQALHRRPSLELRPAPPEVWGLFAARRRGGAGRGDRGVRPAIECSAADLAPSAFIAHNRCTHRAELQAWSWEEA